MRIEISGETAEAEEFAGWLTNQGHDVTIGTSGNYINGVGTGGDEDADRVMNELWEQYCYS